MDRVGIYYNAALGEAEALASAVAGWFGALGSQTWLARGEPVAAGSTGRTPDDGESLTADRLAGSDLLVTLGGDGSILRAAHVAAPLGIPILGVNLGRVGFLTEASPGDWQEVLSHVVAGNYWVEERMMVRAEALRANTTVRHAEALNDVVVARGAQARVVHLSAIVDGGALATYVADGLIVATPTGSTAYALAAGGPILPPQLRNILIVPVAPHLSIARPVVLSEGVRVRIVVEAGHEAVLTVDGAFQCSLSIGDEVSVAASQHPARFARVQEQTYFYRTLASRLAPRP